MNKKGASIIIGAAIIILVVIFAPLKPGDVPPVIEESILIDDNAQVGLQLDTEPVQITDNAIVVTEDVNYFVDENGTKHYFLEAIDKPITDD